MLKIYYWNSMIKRSDRCQEAWITKGLCNRMLVDATNINPSMAISLSPSMIPIANIIYSPPTPWIIGAKLFFIVAGDSYTLKSLPSVRVDLLNERSFHSNHRTFCSDTRRNYLIVRECGLHQELLLRRLTRPRIGRKDLSTLIKQNAINITNPMSIKVHPKPQRKTINC